MEDINEMPLDEIAKAHWSQAKATKAIASLAQEFLDTQGDDATLSTSALLRGLGATIDQFKPIASHLTNARSTGLMERYFDRGTKGTFGHARVIWHARKRMTQAEKVAQVKRDMEAAEPHDADLTDLYDEAD